MRITDIRIEPAGRAIRAAARIAWEESDRPPLDLFFETDEGRAREFRADPNAFLLACALPAMRHGERRLSVEGAICPRLADGLATAAGVLRSWYGPVRRLPAVEPAGGFVAPSPRSPARAGMLFSGGIDSTALLLSNRRDFGRDHPGRISIAFWITAFDAPAEGTAQLAEAISRVTGEAGVDLVHVRSNLRRLDDDLEFFARENLSAAFLSGVHLFSPGVSNVSVASTAPAGRLEPWGSHPLLDPLYSTAALEVRHEMLAVPRLEKARRVAGWPVAVAHLHSCNDEPAGGRLNCGTCEKCVETMIELLVAGHPGPWPSFPETELSPSAISALPVLQDVARGWGALPGPLEAIGRHDLASAVREKLRECDAARRWHEGRNWSGSVRRADSRFFGGRLARTYRSFFRRRD